jgi:hypothetical protein
LNLQKFTVNHKEFPSAIAGSGNNSATTMSSQLEYIGDNSMVLNPLVASHIGRPVRVHNNSTSRDLSCFNMLKIQLDVDAVENTMVLGITAKPAFFGVLP